MTAEPRDDTWMDDCIAHFQQPTHAVDETPQGRVAGMNRDIGLVLAEMRELLSDRKATTNKAEYDQRLAELLEQFGDTHELRMKAYDELLQRALYSHRGARIS